MQIRQELFKQRNLLRDNGKFRNDSNLRLIDYKSIHLGRQNKRGGGVCIFVHEKLIFKQRVDITKIEDDLELLSIEIINKNTKNIIINNCYRPLGGKVRPLKKQIRNVFQKLYRENKMVFIVGDFNLNSLDYSTNTKVKNL